MSESTSIRVLQPLFEGLAQGDLPARDELFRLCAERLRRLARRMLGDFERLRSFEQTDDVLQGAMLRLFASLESLRSPTLGDFLGLAALSMRRELLDLARHHLGRSSAPRPQPRPFDSGTGEERIDPSESTWEPLSLALWTEFHAAVENLPLEEREVFDLLWYQDLSQEDAAQAIGVDRSTIKRRWRAARIRLGSVLPRIG